MNAQKMNEAISPEALYQHWKGHRNLTKKIIEVFPEEAFFNHSIGGMRPFAAMVMELLGIAGPGILEIVNGKSEALVEKFDHQNKKENFLKKWDETTEILEENFLKIKAEQYQDKIKAFGQYEGTVLSTILYYIDNEIHHRAQAYVYLRSLGIEPPAFWDR